MPYLVVDLDTAPKPKFAYKILVLDVCNGARDYSEVFNHGCFISTINFIVTDFNRPYMFTDALINGGDSNKILNVLSATDFGKGEFTKKDFSH